MPRNITCFTQGLRLAKRWNWDSNSVWTSSCFWIQFPADIIQILFLSCWSQRGKWQNVECLLSTFQIFTDRISLEQFSINNDCCWRTALSFCLYYCGYCLFSLIPNIVPIISDCLFFMTWTPCWERLKVGGEGDDRGWDGWMASPTQWTWVWANFGRWWRTEKPSMLQSMGLQRVRHDWVTKQQQPEEKIQF